MNVRKTAEDNPFPGFSVDIKLPHKSAFEDE